MSLLDSVLGTMKTEETRLEFERRLAALRMTRGSAPREARKVGDLRGMGMTLETRCGCGWSKTWSWARLGRDWGRDAPLARARYGCEACGNKATLTQPCANPASRKRS